MTISAVTQKLRNVNWSFIKTSLSTTVGLAIGRVLGLAFSLVLARALRPADYGVVQYSIALAGFVSIGTQAFGQHMFALLIGKHSRDEQQLALFMNNAWAILVSTLALTLLVATPILASMGYLNIGVMAVFIGNTVFYAYYGITRGYLSMNRLTVAFAASNVVQLAAVFVIYVVFHNQSPVPALIAYGTSYFLPLLLLQIYTPVSLHLRLVKPRRDVIQSILHSWTPILVSHTLYTVSGVEFIILGQYVDERAVGRYAFTRTLNAMFGFLPMALNTFLMPSVARAPHHERRRLLRDALLWLLMASALMFVMYVVGYNWIVEKFFGPQYVNGPEVFVVLALSANIAAIHGVTSAFYVGSDRARYETISLVISVAANIVSAFALIPAFGAAGAALSSLTASCAALLSYAIPISWKYYRRRHVTE